MEIKTIMKYTNEERLAYAKSITDEFPPNEIHEISVIHKTAVIGMDGFGWVIEKDGSLYRFPHRGNVVIEKNVVIREFVTVDRAVNGSTVIGEGTCIDHHCHVAHGAKIGKHNTFANGCIIEGSCEIGDYNTFGAGVIVQTKVKIGNSCIFGSGSVVTKDVEDNSIMVGNPARKLEKK
jgi:UDP-3-O-[3-hydroxymyristoyl] glucosamine N-acyltransferase